MFVRGLAKVGDYQPRSWKVENWWKPSAPATLIPGVSNTTVAEVAGGGLLTLAAAWAAAKYFKIF